MKKIMKKVVIVIVSIFAFITTGCSCFYGEEYYDLDGFNITMERGLEESSAPLYDIYLEGSNVIMLAVKDEFGYIIESSYTLSQYTEIVLEGNSLETEVYERENQDYLYFTYNRTVGNDNFYYFAISFKTDDAFWLIQFACHEDDVDDYKPRFFSWADSIEFDDTK